MKVLQTLVRIYVEDLDSSLNFYENLLGVKCNFKFSYSEVGLELASLRSISVMLILFLYR